MAKPIKVLVACGSGVATSTIVVQVIKDLFKERNVNAEVIKCTLAEIPNKEEYVDVILTTNNYRRPVSKPILSVFGLISGINEDQIKDKIVDLCNEVQKTKE